MISTLLLTGFCNKEKKLCLCLLNTVSSSGSIREGLSEFKYKLTILNSSLYGFQNSSGAGTIKHQGTALYFNNKHLLTYLHSC